MAELERLLAVAPPTMPAPPSTCDACPPSRCTCDACLPSRCTRSARLRNECDAAVSMLQRLWGASRMGACPAPSLPTAVEEWGLDAALFVASLTSIPPTVMAGVCARHEACRAVEALADALDDVPRFARNAAARVQQLEVRTMRCVYVQWGG